MPSEGNYTHALAFDMSTLDNSLVAAEPPLRLWAAITAPSPAQTATATRPRLVTLDGLRGVAILLVLLFHFVSLDTARAPHLVAIANEYLQYGATGVNLFFVLSGFLITGILIDTKSNCHYFRNFYARRFLRIVPLYYGYLIGALVVGRAFSFYNSPTLRLEAHHQLFLWTYTSNLFEAFQGKYFQVFRHFWSLAVEEQFYLFWPLLVFVLPRRALTWLCIGGVLLGPLTRLVLRLTSGVNFTEEQLALTPCHVDALSLGALVAIGLRSQRIWPSLVRCARVTFPMCFAAVCILIMISGAPDPSHNFAAQLSINSTINVCAASVLVLAVAASETSIVGNWLSARPLVFMGKYSYGLYVLHPTVLRIVEKFVTPRSLATGLHSYVLAGGLYVSLLFLLSIAAAYVSWHGYEVHFLKLKRYFPE